MNAFVKIYAALRLNEAVRRADKAHASDGERYYVMPIFGSRGKLIITDRRNFRILKRKGYISSNVRVSHLVDECFYCTPYKNGDGRLPGMVADMKKNQYFEWFNDARKIRKH